MKSDHPPVNFGKTGVLLINLGTPDSTNWWDIRKYLKEFLSDTRVIEVNPMLWKIILNLFILNLRPTKTAKAYKEIWLEKENMSPLRYFTIMQTKKLIDKIGNKNKAIESYKNSIQINDKFEKSFFNLGSIYLEQKNYSEAKSCFEKVLDIKPNQDFLLGNIFYTNASLCDWSSFENLKEELENKIQDGQKVCLPFHSLALTNSPELLTILSR